MVTFILGFIVGVIVMLVWGSIVAWRGVRRKQRAERQDLWGDEGFNAYVESRLKE